MKSFCLLLAKKCYCEVYVDLWCESRIAAEKELWIPREMALADIIIFVLSPIAIARIHQATNKRLRGLQENEMSLLKAQPMPEDTFLQGFQRFVERSIDQTGVKMMCSALSVDFDYVGACKLKLPCIKGPYRLVDDIEKLVLELHDSKSPLVNVPQQLLNTQLSICHPSNDNKNTIDTEPYRNFLSAIAAMNAVAKKNNRWFEQDGGERHMVHNNNYPMVFDSQWDGTFDDTSFSAPSITSSTEPTITNITTSLDVHTTNASTPLPAYRSNTSCAASSESDSFAAVIQELNADFDQINIRRIPNRINFR